MMVHVFLTRCPGEMPRVLCAILWPSSDQMLTVWLTETGDVIFALCGACQNDL